MGRRTGELEHWGFFIEEAFPRDYGDTRMNVKNYEPNEPELSRGGRDRARLWVEVF